MTDLLEQAIARVRSLPAEAQDDVARAMLAVIDDEQSLVVLSPEEKASFAKSLAQVSCTGRPGRVRERRAGPGHLGEARPVRLRYTPEAADELERILDGISEKSPSGGRRVLARIQAATDRLLDQPRSGSPTDLRPMHRTLACTGPWSALT